MKPVAKLSLPHELKQQSNTAGCYSRCSESNRQRQPGGVADSEGASNETVKRQTHQHQYGCFTVCGTEKQKGQLLPGMSDKRESAWSCNQHGHYMPVF
jgi:hypothetical protein